mmetsp:Transcript_9922/g.25287  ORF Transcript_9922/g.25287 Transcript_9922/m.25287 type:complete len:143 (-) Transcript_9922:99-527(-)
MTKGYEADGGDGGDANQRIPNLAKENKLDQVKALLAQGVDADQKSSRWSPDHEMRGLHFAAYYGHTNLVKLLLDAGADYERKVDERYTPLHYAVFFKHYDVVQCLVDSGADPLVPDDEGRTPIGRAVETSDNKMIAILRKEK